MFTKIKEWYCSLDESKRFTTVLACINILLILVLIGFLISSCLSVSAENLNLNTEDFQFNAKDVKINSLTSDKNSTDVLSFVTMIEKDTCFMMYADKVAYLEKLGFTPTSYEQYLNTNKICIYHNSDGTLKEVTYGN